MICPMLPMLFAASALLVGAYPSSNGSPHQWNYPIHAHMIDTETILFNGRLYHAQQPATVSDSLRGSSLHSSSSRRTDGVTPADGAQFYVDLGMCFLCISISAVASGLMLGLLSIDKLQMQILMEANLDEIHDEDAKQGMGLEKQRAGVIWPLIQDHHRLLVTLMLLNAIANEALPIFLDKLVPSPIIAVAVSVTVVLLFGEIIPSAIFTGPSQLQIAAFLSPLVFAIRFCFYPIARPLGCLLDYLLGSEESHRYTKAELKALVRLHKSNKKPLSEEEEARGLQQLADSLCSDEVTIIQGVLDMRDLQVHDAMRQLGPSNPSSGKDVALRSSTYMLSADCIVNVEFLAELVAAGHSRIPVYRGARANVIGILLVKKLIVVDPAHGRKVGSLPLREPVFVSESCNLQDLLNIFQQHKRHFGVVTRDPAACKERVEAGLPLTSGDVIGCITIEDVLERLICAEIRDETDFSSFRNELATALTLNRRVSALKELAADEMRLRKLTMRATALMRTRSTLMGGWQTMAASVAPHGSSHSQTCAHSGLPAQAKHAPLFGRLSRHSGASTIAGTPRHSRVSSAMEHGQTPLLASNMLPVAFNSHSGDEPRGSSDQP